MSENEITTKMQELPLGVRARCLLSAIQNIYRQANDLGMLSADEIEATIETAWRDHKASNTMKTQPASDIRCRNCDRLFDVMRAEVGDRTLENTLTGLKDINNPWVKCPHCGVSM